MTLLHVTAINGILEWGPARSVYVQIPTMFVCVIRSSSSTMRPVIMVHDGPQVDSARERERILTMAGTGLRPSIIHGAAKDGRKGVYWTPPTEPDGCEANDPTCPTAQRVDARASRGTRGEGMDEAHQKLKESAPLGNCWAAKGDFACNTGGHEDHNQEGEKEQYAESKGDTKKKDATRGAWPKG